MTRRIFGFSMAMLAGALLAACASSGGGAGGSNNANVAFDVDNNLSGLAVVTVYLERESGSRRMVGIVQSGRRQNFTESVRPGTYNLLARGGPNGDFQSERFRLESGELIVSWDLRANVIRVGVKSQ